MAQKKAAAKSRKPKVEDLELEDDDFEVEDEDEEEAAKPKKGKGRSSKPKKEATPRGIGARQIADRLECEPKTFRAWLRRKVDAGDFPEIAEREPRSRYDFGMEWTDPLIVKIMDAWKAEPHERGAGLKKAQEAKAAKSKAPAKKKASTKKKAVVEDDDDDEDFDDED